MKHLKYYKNFAQQKKPAKSAKFQLFCLLLVIITQAFSVQLSATPLSDIYKNIRNDDLDNAYILLQGIISSEYANSELFYLQGVLEPDGQQSLGYFLKALELGFDKKVIAVSLISACRYYLISGKHDEGLELIKKYHKKCKKTNFYPEIIDLKYRLAAANGEKSGSDKELRKQFKKTSTNQSETEILLTLAEHSYRKKDMSKSVKYLHNIVDLSGNKYDALGLANLVNLYIKISDFDNAQLSYNMLVSSYPNALGTKELSAMVSNKQTEYNQPAPERLYGIRIGSFSNKKNADKLASKFRAKGYSINISLAQISGRRYFVVDLGRFSSKSAAVVLRNKLEKRYNDNYSIVLL